MWPRVSIVVGLLAGVAVAVLVLGGILFMGPTPPLAPAATPSQAAAPSASAVPASDAVQTATPSPSLEPSPSAVTLFHIGEPAPALVLPKVGGGTVDLADLKGKPVWVNFMGTYCPPCKDEFPLMDGFATRYAEAGLVVLAVDVREDEGTAAAFAEVLNTTFPIGLDADGAVTDAWGAAALPVHYWIDAEGIVRDAALGGIGPDIMAAAVAKILPGVDVQP
jgi:thiol-disulfide isomerase/thioredoxin